MDGYSPESYGDQWAEVYDDLFPPPGSEVIDFLTARAGGGPVLELAVGTGRVALPLAETCLEVHGIGSPGTCSPDYVRRARRFR